MLTVPELIHFVLNHPRTIVFGNLSRYPEILMQSLAAASLRVVLVSDRFSASSTDPRIRVQRPTEPVGTCDLLVYVEPTQLVRKQPGAVRVAVFASQYDFETPPGERWLDACYFHGADATSTQHLLSRQDFPIQTRNIRLVEMDHERVVKISGRSSPSPPLAHSYAILDLTPFAQNDRNMYLAFWDAFDYLLEHQTSIDRWVACFPDRGRHSFLSYTQKVLDALFCRQFEHGNVTDRRDILALLPYYRSGSIDATFELKVSSFGGVPFSAPASIEEACKVAAMRDVIPVARNVLWVMP